MLKSHPQGRHFFPLDVAKEQKKEAYFSLSGGNAEGKSSRINNIGANMYGIRVWMERRENVCKEMVNKEHMWSPNIPKNQEVTYT